MVSPTSTDWPSVGELLSSDGVGWPVKCVVVSTSCSKLAVLTSVASCGTAPVTKASNSTVAVASGGSVIDQVRGSCPAAVPGAGPDFTEPPPVVDDVAEPAV